MTNARSVLSPHSDPRRDPPLEELQKAVTDAAFAAGEVLLYHFGRNLDVSEKKGAGLVTNVDHEAQKMAVDLLKHRFPHFSFLTEEAAPEVTQSPGRFIIDPLDGTSNYVHGLPVFCVSIAAEWNQRLVVGAIYQPILKDLYLGVKGKGATLNGRPITVSRVSDISKSLLTTGFVYRKNPALREGMQAFERLSGQALAIRRLGSVALDLAYTAQGVFEGFWERGLSPWDVAAGTLIVEEAGGRVTDFEGRPFHLESEEILATNQAMHPFLLQEVRPG